VETVLDAALLQRLTPKLDAEPAVEYICPKLETLACVLGDGHTEATKARFIDYIEARRKAVKAGRVGYLKKVDVKFRVGPVDTIETLCTATRRSDQRRVAVFPCANSTSDHWVGEPDTQGVVQTTKVDIVNTNSIIV
jgi:hypothetical protein